MEILNEKEIARATVLFSIRTSVELTDIENEDRTIYFTYYGQCKNTVGEVDSRGKDVYKVGKLFQHSMKLSAYNKLVDERGLEEVIGTLEHYRKNPLETIIRIIKKDEEGE